MTDDRFSAILVVVGILVAVAILAIAVSLASHETKQLRRDCIATHTPAECMLLERAP